MTISGRIRQHLGRIAHGKPFIVEPLLRYGSAAAVYQTLSRLVKQGEIARVARGVYVRPKTNPYVGKVLPSLEAVLEVKAKGETLEVQGAEAIQLLGLSTQVPMQAIYYTNGRSRLIHVGNLTVKLKHVCERKLALAGTKVGLVLQALWYLGAKQMNDFVLNQILKHLSPTEQQTLWQAPLTQWMRKALAGRLSYA